MPLVKLAKTRIKYKKQQPAEGEAEAVGAITVDDGEVPNAVKKNSTQQNFLPALDFTNMGTSIPEIPQISAHDAKEKEILQELYSNPHRGIHLVEQKSAAQKKLEEKFSFEKTYNRLSLPSVDKMRMMKALNPHQNVQLSKAQRIMQYNKHKSTSKISDIIGEHSINNKKYRSNSTATGEAPTEKQE